jgi:cysteine desulfurase / selenocysteine lyase
VVEVGWEWGRADFIPFLENPTYPPTQPQRHGNNHRGPRGVGFLFVNPSATLLEPSHLDLRGATWILDPSSRWTYEVDKSAKRYEFWEGSVANKLAFGKAVEVAQEIGVGNIRERVRGLADMTRKMVESELGMKCMDVRDGELKELSGICSFDASPIGGADRAVEMMAGLGISISATGTSSTLHDARERDLPER